MRVNTKLLRIVFAFAVTASSCQKKTPVDNASEAQRQITALEAKVASLEKERKTQTPTAEDGAARLKRLIEEFPSTLKGRSARWRVRSYDITRTDSVVSPLVALILIDCHERNENENHPYRLYLALQNNVWQIKRLEYIPYDPGSRLDEDMWRPDKSTDIDWQVLQDYFR